MKKSSIFLIAGIAVVLFLLFQFRGCFGCGIKSSGGKILVEKITKVETEEKGDWEDSPVVPVDADEDHFVESTIDSLQKARDHFFGRYQFYKKEAYSLLERMQSLSNNVEGASGCEEALAFKDEQILVLLQKIRRDSVLLEELFEEYDNKGERRRYAGTVNGDNFTTQWRADVFGVMPPDGMQIKTDVTSITTTIEKPYEVWRKNQVEMFGGADTDFEYFLGLGYERRNKWIGLFGQGEYYPEIKRGVGKGGVRIHF